jgi:hypothetical protein
LVRFQNCVGRFAAAAPDAAPSAVKTMGKYNKRFMIESISLNQNRPFAESKKSA